MVHRHGITDDSGALLESTVGILSEEAVSHPETQLVNHQWNP